jgi:hypothetical protein
LLISGEVFAWTRNYHINVYSSRANDLKNFFQETLYLSIAILDRYLSLEGLRVKRQKLQLIGVSSMFIASKYEEMYPPEIGEFNMQTIFFIVMQGARG